MKIVSQLIQVDDTDFPRFSKNEKGMNLDTMHNWITGNDKKRERKYRRKPEKNCRAE